MDNNEICRSYKEARNKKSQIGILAELNLCSTKDIIEILKEGGVYIAPKVRSKDEQASKPAPKETAVTNEGFATAVDEMTGKRAPLPGVIEEAVCYAVEAMDEQIEKYEQEQEALGKKIAELNEKRRSIMEYIKRPIYE
ncbi:MAG: hypothetical protein IKO76_06645 [Butyrivibrio sp.]|nr:hypothetical protein [Butyrivibrio sp.]